MSLALKPPMDAFVQELVSSGRFESESEAVDAALQLMQEREVQYQKLKLDIESGIKSGDAGPFDDGLGQQIKSLGRARLAARLASE